MIAYRKMFYDLFGIVSYLEYFWNGPEKPFMVLNISNVLIDVPCNVSFYARSYMYVPTGN